MFRPAPGFGQSRVSGRPGVALRFRSNARRGSMSAMRRLLKRYLPDHDSVRNNRWLSPFSNSLLHPRLWHLNRHSVAGGVAVGLFCGLVPGPFQMPSAALACVLLRVNLPLALLTTLYTNPFTILPLYAAAFAVGNLLLGNGGLAFVPPPELWKLPVADWASAGLGWVLGVGKPLALGLLILACGLSALGYGAVRLAWRIHLALRLRERRRSRTHT